APPLPLRRARVAPPTVSARLPDELEQPLLGEGGGRPLRGDGSAAHADDAVGELEDLLQLRGGEADGEPFGCELAQQAVDLRLRAHVDAAGGVAEEYDLRLHREAPAEQDALLV